MAFKSRLALPRLFARRLADRHGAGPRSAAAQDWKGRGRARGSVQDEKGKGIAGATRVALVQRRQRGRPDRQNRQEGQWAYIGLVTGDFTVDIDAEGYVGVEASQHIDEYAPEGDPAARGGARKADGGGGGGAGNPEGDRLMQVLAAGNEKLKNKDFAGARAAYQEVMAAVKDDKQKLSLQVAIAGTWLDEGKGPEARAAFEELCRPPKIRPPRWPTCSGSPAPTTSKTTSTPRSPPSKRRSPSIRPTSPPCG